MVGGEKPHTRRGFTLYYAALFGSVLVLIGASMLNISLKEFLLSSSIRESEYAFFAADSGTECALYWDLRLLDAFATTSGTAGTKWSSINCAGVTVTSGWPYTASAIPALVTSSNSATSTFHYSFGTAPRRYCVLVQVIKRIEPFLGVTTIVDARGYNFGCDTSDTRRIERALITRYPSLF